jgi:hypothetical protein
MLVGDQAFEGDQYTSPEVRGGFKGTFVMEILQTTGLSAPGVTVTVQSKNSVETTWTDGPNGTKNGTGFIILNATELKQFVRLKVSVTANTSKPQVRFFAFAPQYGNA